MDMWTVADITGRLRLCGTGGCADGETENQEHKVHGPGHGSTVPPKETTDDCIVK